MFKNLKIGVRLGIGFGLVLVLLVVVATLASVQLSSLNSGIGIMVNDRFPKTVVLNDTIDNVNQVAMSVRNMLLIKDPERIKAELERIAAARKQVSDNYASLEKSITSDTEKKMLADTLVARKEYVADLDKFLEAQKAGKIEEAT